MLLYFSQSIEKQIIIKILQLNCGKVKYNNIYIYKYIICNLLKKIGRFKTGLYNKYIIYEIRRASCCLLIPNRIPPSGTHLLFLHILVLH